MSFVSQQQSFLWSDHRIYKDYTEMSHKAYSPNAWRSWVFARTLVTWAYDTVSLYTIHAAAVFHIIPMSLCHLHETGIRIGCLWIKAGSQSYAKPCDSYTYEQCNNALLSCNVSEGSSVVELWALTRPSLCTLIDLSHSYTNWRLCPILV